MIQKLLKGFIAVGIAAMIFGQCISYSPFEITLEDHEKDLTQKNLNRLLDNPTGNSDTVTFAFIGDTQRFYDASTDFVNVLNKRSDIEFVIHSGDISDFGLDLEFSLMAEILGKLKVPYLTVIGNHDIIYNGRRIYEQMFGPMDYSFTYKGFRFVMLNTNGREFGFSGKVPDIPWLDEQLSDTSHYKNALVIQHVPPGNDDFDNTLETSYAQTLSKWGKTLLSMNGHNHDYSIGEPYNDGVTYLNSFSTSKKSYVVVKIWEGGFSHVVVDF
ncbi:metallophosphoesterase [Rapidithrix thailandica]|uniref:Metallophosphoesterase n=1 Tax=Rapidithrix thailandica TaxID=413964 RepID=A0AAW9S7C0_9BACT